LNLDLENVAVSTGSACTSGTLEPSHVLLAMGRSAEEAHGSLRFSFGRANRDEDVDATVDALVRVVERLRRMSPLGEKSVR
jgi:cysteine desulfurase